MLPKFDLNRPTTIDEALSLKEELGPDAMWYAGGTELLLAMKLGMFRPKSLIDLKRISGLHSISLSNSERLVISGMATHQEIAVNPQVQTDWPALTKLESEIGNIRVRSAGTLAGNLAFAEPRSDPATFLLAIGAEIRIRSITGVHTIPLSNFLRGPFATALGPDEILEAIVLPEPKASAYVKFQTLERPTVGVAVAVELDGSGWIKEARLCVGAATEVPKLCVEASSFLIGAPPMSHSPNTINAARSASNEVETISDVSGSAEFKKHLITTLVPQVIGRLAAKFGTRDVGIDRKGGESL